MFPATIVKRLKRWKNILPSHSIAIHASTFYRYGLLVDEFSQYDPRMQPDIMNSFAAAAFRFGHSMINSMFMLVSQRKPRNQVSQ